MGESIEVRRRTPAEQIDYVRDRVIEAADALTDMRLLAERAEQERSKLAATVAAYLGTDERAVHDAGNLAHARDLRDAAVRRAERAEAAIERVRALHVRVDRGAPTPHACGACLAGYDRLTGELVYAAWPCMTIAALDSTDPPASGEGGGTLLGVADALERYAENYPESVFPPDSDVRDAIGGTAMRHAYRNAARMLREAAAADLARRTVEDYHRRQHPAAEWGLG